MHKGRLLELTSILSNCEDDLGAARDELYEDNGGGLGVFEEYRGLGGRSRGDDGMSGSDFSYF